MVLDQLSPNAAKIYLALNTLSAPADNPRIARITVAALSGLAGLAPRTCAYALRELQNLQLISSLPRRSGSASYRIEPFPCTPAPAGALHPHAARPAPTPSPLHRGAARPASTLHPHAVSSLSTLHHHAASPASTLDSSRKTHNLHPGAATQSNPADPLDDPLLDPALLKFLMAQLSPAEQASLLAPIQPLLASLSSKCQQEARS